MMVEPGSHSTTDNEKPGSFTNKETHNMTMHIKPWGVYLLSTPKPIIPYVFGHELYLQTHIK